MLICREPIVRSLTRRCAEPGNPSAANSGTATLSIGTESAISQAAAAYGFWRPSLSVIDHGRHLAHTVGSFWRVTGSDLVWSDRIRMDLLWRGLVEKCCKCLPFWGSKI